MAFPDYTISGDTIGEPTAGDHSKADYLEGSHKRLSGRMLSHVRLSYRYALFSVSNECMGIDMARVVGLANVVVSGLNNSRYVCRLAGWKK